MCYSPSSRVRLACNHVCYCTSIRSPLVACHHHLLEPTVPLLLCLSPVGKWQPEGVMAHCGGHRDSSASGVLSA